MNKCTRNRTRSPKHFLYHLLLLGLLVLLPVSQAQADQINMDFIINYAAPTDISNSHNLSIEWDITPIGGTRQFIIMSGINPNSSVTETSTFNEYPSLYDIIVGGTLFGKTEGDAKLSILPSYNAISEDTAPWVGSIVFTGAVYPGIDLNGRLYTWVSNKAIQVGTFELKTEATATAPVPEPATLVLLGAGLIGLAGYGRSKLS
jgi:hypothetical protein